VNKCPRSLERAERRKWISQVSDTHFFLGACNRRRWLHLFGMRLTEIQDLAIQARMALIVGAKTFDRLFAGIRFDELEGPLLYVYAKDEQTAAEIEDDFSLHIATVAAAILNQGVDVVVVMPKVLN
jgi:hypothetical protein